MESIESERIICCRNISIETEILKIHKHNFAIGIYTILSIIKDRVISSFISMGAFENR